MPKLRLFILISLLLYPFLGRPQVFNKKYILSGHYCPIPNCGGPQNHTVFLAESDDAENWTLISGFPSYNGSVPDVITRNEKLYIFTPGKVMRFNHTLNQWDSNPVNVNIVDSIGNPVQFADPSAYVDDNGNLCLFFLNTTGIVGDPAQCATPPCTAFFDSATEIAGSDGTQFVKQNGHRMTYTTNTNFKPTDPDIFKNGNSYFLYISYGSGTMVYSCNSLHGNYVLMPTLPNGYLTQNNAGIPCGFFNSSNNLYYSYGHRNAANGSEIMLAKHPDFNTQANYNLLFNGSGIGLGNVQVASPGICENSFLPTYINQYEYKNAVSIIPNPNFGNFILQINGQIAKVIIQDLTGKIIATHLKKANTNVISIANLPKGLYIASYYEDVHVVGYAKIIVQ